MGGERTSSGMGWSKEFRLGGDAGEIDPSLPGKDTDTRDPDWTTSSPVQLPTLHRGPLVAPADRGPGLRRTPIES
jgi:hypothetical protein